ncbi:conserved protein of unknown function [Ectopseudomonas oleovorans]|uniref:Uncharacterized protein n=1 Tax=Ectopseudomonas oleovorans TaxID=301 RepID=A0A653B6S2_ECTOL|nr:conserved protein of unknown function [Pseudomonas oleovorans]
MYRGIRRNPPHNALAQGLKRPYPLKENVYYL